MPRAMLVCLLPVRNGADDLPGFFASVERFADAVVALDDGSNDDTRALLQAHPLVKRLLTNPPRADYQGWDDAENRNRLLEAAAELEPDWILSLDADERLDAEDGAALRAFIDHDALPGCAYGFKVHRMWEDEHRYERAGLWVYRLFHYEAGQRFPDKRLHFVPVPTSIPSDRWIRTTIRIQHLGALTEAHRHARYEKYQQADPDRAFQHSYEELLDADLDNVRPWETRSHDWPILDVSERKEKVDLQELDTPALSAIIISRDDEARIERTVSSVVNQQLPWPFEVIVVTSGSDRTAEIVRQRYPQVTVVELDTPALPGEARNAGLRIAQGDCISFPGSHVELPPGSLAARLRAHDLGYAMVTGSTLNGTQTRAGWASYFIDHSGSLPGRPSMELKGAPSHCSYLRGPLMDIGGFPEGLRAGEDTEVNNKLWRQGHRAYRSQELTIIHHSPCRSVDRLVRHHFLRGRGFGRILLNDRAEGKRVNFRTALRLFRLQVVDRVSGIGERVEEWGTPEIQRQYDLPVRFLILVGAISAYVGTWYEVARAGRKGLRIPPRDSIVTSVK